MWFVHHLAWGQPEGAKLFARRNTWFTVDRLPDQPDGSCHSARQAESGRFLCLKEVDNNSDLPYFSILQYNIFTFSALGIEVFLEMTASAQYRLKRPPSQSRLRVCLRGDSSYATLDDEVIPVKLAAAIFLNALIEADGGEVAFADLKRKHTAELESAASDRVLKSLDRRILKFIIHGKGKPARLDVEMLR
jgi:hypothetical protein